MFGATEFMLTFRIKHTLAVNLCPTGISLPVDLVTLSCKRAGNNGMTRGREDARDKFSLKREIRTKFNPRCLYNTHDAPPQIKLQLKIRQRVKHALLCDRKYPHKLLFAKRTREIV